jgi:hypothetical protein
MVSKRDARQCGETVGTHAMVAVCYRQLLICTEHRGEQTSWRCACSCSDKEVMLIRRREMFGGSSRRPQVVMGWHSWVCLSFSTSESALMRAMFPRMDWPVRGVNTLRRIGPRRGIDKMHGHGTRDVFILRKYHFLCSLGPAGTMFHGDALIPRRKILRYPPLRPGRASGC